MGTAILAEQELGFGHLPGTAPGGRALEGRIGGGGAEGMHLGTARRIRIAGGHQMPGQRLPGHRIVGVAVHLLLPGQEGGISGARRPGGGRGGSGSGGRRWGRGGHDNPGLCLNSVCARVGAACRRRTSC